MVLIGDVFNRHQAGIAGIAPMFSLFNNVTKIFIYNFRKPAGSGTLKSKKHFTFDALNALNLLSPPYFWCHTFVLFCQIVILM